MATAGEGTSYEQGGGAGGKFRKRPFRRAQATPYDRPPTAIRNPKTGWLSKFVDPASKLISASAQRFFSSFFHKRLTHPPPPPQQSSPGEIDESRDTLQALEVAVPINHPEAKASAMYHELNQTTNSSESRGISDLEKMLTHNTFTRDEIDRLTQLLRSRTVDLPVGGEERMTEAILPKSSGYESREGLARSPLSENGIGVSHHRSHGVVSTPIVSSRVVDDDVASPAELAKAYMGSRPSKVSPSLLGLRSEALKEDVPLLSNVPFHSKSPIMSLAPKTAVRVGVPDNGFITPRTRGRSAIYSMARTPYSRVYSTANQKGVRFANDGGGPSSLSSSQYTAEHYGVDEHLRSKQALKRRSSVFNEDIGSVGPIRRIRQKPNLSSTSGLSLPVTGNPTSSRAMRAGPSASAQEKLLLLDNPKYEDNCIHNASFALVPSKSSETATKILQHLEKLTPKEKSSESKLANVRDRSPAKLTPSMLSGKALKSLENVESSNFFQNVKDSQKLEASNTTIRSGVAWESSGSPKQGKAENGNKTLFAPRDTLAPVVDLSTPVSIKHSPSNTKNVDSASKILVSQPPKRRPFQMSAHEDSWELDDDVHSNGDASTPSADGGDKPVMPRDSKIIEATTMARNLDVPKVKTPAGPELKKRTNLEFTDGFNSGEKKNSFTFTMPTPKTTPQPILSTSESVSALDNTVQPNQTNASPPLFSFGSKSAEKLPTFNFHASSSPSESSLIKSDASPDPKPESSKSFLSVSFGATTTKIPESDKGGVDRDSTQKVGGDIKGMPVATFPSSAISSSATTSLSSSIFSFGAPTNSTPNNGAASSPFMFSSSAPVPVPSFSNHVNQNVVTNGGSSTTTSPPTTSTTNTTTVTAPPSSGGSSLASSAVVTPSSSTAPPPMGGSGGMFRFGSSTVPTVASTSSSEVQNSTTLKVNDDKKEGSFGNNLSSSTSAFGSGGGGTFGFGGASPAFSTVNKQSQEGGSLFGTGSSAPSLGGATATTVSQTSTTTTTTTTASPFQFGSSSSSGAAPLFNSGFTSSSSSSLFGSSTPTTAANNIFSSSGSSFGVSASSGTNSSSSAAAATSNSLFSSSWQQQTKSTPVFGASTGSSLFNSQSSPSTGFSFGASAATPVASTAASSSPSMVFGASSAASSGSPFSFTSAAVPPAANNTSTSFGQMQQPVFGNNSTTSVFTASPVFGNNSNNDQMEDSMAEDNPVQASAQPPVLPVFSQPPPPSGGGGGFMFGSSTPFQFGGGGGGQPTQAAPPQNPTPFASSGSLDFSAGGGGGSFSLGSGGGDKSGRKIIKVKHRQNRKK